MSLLRLRVQYTDLVEYVHGGRVRDDGSLVVQLQDGLAPNVHHQRVDARHVVRHARVSRLTTKKKKGKKNE